jgi:hypothetical protein
LALLLSELVLGLAFVSPTAIAWLILIAFPALIVPLLVSRRQPKDNLWDRTMLSTSGSGRWTGNLWIWWSLLAAILVGIYAWLW